MLVTPQVTPEFIMEFNVEVENLNIQMNLLVFYFAIQYIILFCLSSCILLYKWLNAVARIRFKSS